MKHVNAIKKMLDEGEVRAAESALEGLLALGPKNLDALKLKAQIYGSEGRFREEDKVWLQILKVDGEDPDALSFFQRRHIEDREHYYFTDELPSGGRRFLAYPRALINLSVLGLTGCIGFLLLTRMSERSAILQDPNVVFTTFALMVVSPWVAIIITYCRSLRAIDVSAKGISFSSRLRTHEFSWPEVTKLCLSFGNNPSEPDLRLIVVPKEEAKRPIEVNFNTESSPIRARTHLVYEITVHYGPVPHESYATLDLKGRRPVTFE